MNHDDEDDDDSMNPWKICGNMMGAFLCGSLLYMLDHG
jgi:hypothetical protein